MVDRVYQRNATAAPPAVPDAPSEGYPTNGNPAGAIPATIPGAYWYHMITESLRNVIVAAGLDPDHEDLGQLVEAMTALAPAQNIAVFDAPGVYEWTVPEILKAGWIKPWVEVIGAGAAGGSNESSGGGGGGPGGGRGGFFDLTGVDTVTITVGAGGVGVSGSQGGNNGESSSFGSYMTAPGGTGGGTDAGRSAPEGVGGDIPIMLATSGGAALQYEAAQRYVSGEGGGPGGVGRAGTSAAPGNDGVGPGGGGSGSLLGDTSGSGHSGSVTIKW